MGRIIWNTPLTHPTPSGSYVADMYIYIVLYTKVYPSMSSPSPPIPLAGEGVGGTEGKIG